MTRTIKHVSQPDARFEGTATWAKDGQAGRVVYEETGRLFVTGYPPLNGERRYFWDAALNVYFDDGRFFHTVPSQGGQAEHWCDPDHYVVAYDFGHWPVFSVTWTVQGPRKSYVSRSRYTPMPK